jgi:hypothetical protein
MSFDAGRVPSSVAIADLNADGVPDLVLAGGGWPTVSVLLGNGDGTFRPRTEVTVENGAISAAIADLNADGRPDLVVTTSAQPGGISVLLGNGDGTFGAEAKPATGGDPKLEAIADLNADGRPDLVVTSHDCSTSCVYTVSVLIANGDGTFTAGPDLSGDGQSVGFVGTADMDGDAKPDLVISHSDRVSVLLGIGDGTFEPGTDIRTAFGGALEAITDLNGDGRLDLVTMSSGPYDSFIGEFVGPGTVSVLLGNRDGTFGPRTDFGTGIDPSSVAIADLNADGRPDLVVANAGYHGEYGNTVSVLLGKGDGTFGPKTDFQTSVGALALATADLNGDGRPDLAVACAESGTVSVLLGNGNGTFGPEKFGTGTGPLSVAIADFNEDGRPDLAVANSTSGTVSVLLGNGDGRFGAKLDTNTGSYPNSMAIGDFNADGRPDLAVASYFYGPVPISTILVLLGNGDGTFRATTEFITGSDRASVAAADLNADGRPDLLVCSSVVRVSLGNGDGTFGTMTDIAAGGGTGSLAIGDLNADGRPDLAVSHPTSGMVSVLLGRGDGTFGGTTDFDAGSTPYPVTIADLNADGRPDLLVMSSDSATVSVLLGKGDGRFGTRTAFSAEAGQMAIADLNADGRLDLAVANGDAVSVLLGSGDGSLGTETRFGTGGNSASVAIGDLNADGRPDLAVVNYYSNTVSVLLHTGTNAPEVVPPPLALGLFAPRPNPSRGTSEIRFVLPSERTVEIELFDVTGRRVWSWASRANLSAGPHTVTWNGRDGSGTAARSGVYFLEVRAGVDQGVTRLVLQR